MLERLTRFFTSLRLTIVLLACGIVLVFFGTLAQEPLGLYDVQARYFRSFFVDANALYGGFHKLVDMLMQGFGYPLQPIPPYALKERTFPIFPGGYLVGGLLLINLFSAHLRYYQPGKKKFGIAMIHLGIVLLLIGQFLTDALSVESVMHIRNGQSRNYSEASRVFELAFVDTTDADSDKVVAIRNWRLQKSEDIKHAELPVTVRVKTFFANSDLSDTNAPGLDRVPCTQGFGTNLWWRSLPLTTKTDMRDMPSGIVELITPQGSLGTFLISAYLNRAQPLVYNGRLWEFALRPERFYKPFSLHLVEFRHDIYPGTDIPKDFSSIVRLQRPDTGEDREVRIFMNNPLRYNGETYYQASFDPDDQGTVLQVVRNPSSISPYMGCWIVALGLTLQFLSHFLDFLKMGISSKMSEADRRAQFGKAVQWSGISGWLLLSAIGLLMITVGWPWLHVGHLIDRGRSLAAGQKFPLFWQWLVVLAFWGYVLFTGWLFFNRRPSAPLNVMFVVVLLPVAWVVLGAVGDVTIGDRSLALNSYVGATSQGLISIVAFFLSAFWILYLMRAKRVAATFTK